MYTQRPFGWEEERISVKLSERRTLGTGTPLPLGQCRRRWSRAPTGQRDGVAWRRRGQDTVDTLDETCTSTECRRERGARSEERGARSQEPGARSEGRGARTWGRLHHVGRGDPVALTDSSCRALPDDNRQKQFHRSLPDGQQTETIKHLVLKFNAGDVGRTV